ncbi:MAG TPA: DUF5317 family protein [Actinomycetes bacterium]
MGEPLVFLLVGGAAVVAGLARGGVLRGLARTGLRHRRLGLVCLAVQAVVVALPLQAVGLPLGLGALLLAVALAVLLAVARPNGRLAGVPLIALGLLLNLVAVVANAGMPTSEATLARAGVAVSRPLPHRPDAKHVLGQGTRLGLLGDRLAVRPLRAVVSYGTVCQLAGLFLLVQHLLLAAAAGRRGDAAHGAHEARTVPWGTWAD